MRRRYKHGSRAAARKSTCGLRRGLLFLLGLVGSSGLAQRALAGGDLGTKACTGPRGDGVLLVGTVSGPNLKDDRRVLIERLTSSILVGARAAKTESDHPTFKYVLAFDEIVLQQKRLQAEVLDSARLVGVVDMRSASPLISKVISKEGTITGYLQPSISEMQGDLRIDLQLYCRSRPQDDWKLVALKKVGGSGGRESEILDLVVDAARRLRNLESGVKPQAVIDVQPSRRVKLGTTVVLDGTRSLDPDHDALVLRWKQTGGTERYLPKDGVMRDRIEFTADAEGTYAFQLTAEEVVAHGTAGSSSETAADASDVATATVEVWRAPNPITESSRQVDLNLKSPKHVNLVGRCESCASWEWRQVAGPQVKITCSSAEQSSSDARSGPEGCKFRPSVPGEYVFQLIGRNALDENSSKVAFLVAPKPFVIAGPRHVSAVLGEPLKLDASASYDTLDPDPLFQWEARETPFPAQKDCFPSGDYRNGAMVLTPTGRTATFQSNERKTYFVRLTMRARRFFDQREMWSYDCSTMEVQVEPRPWTIFVGGGGQMNGGTGDNRIRSAVGANIRWRGPWGLRFTQSLFSYKVGSKSEDEERFKGFGGSTVAASYTLDKDSWAARAHLGAYAQVSSSQTRAGPSGGVEVILSLRDIWVLLVGANVQYPWSSGDSPPSRWELAGWTGVGRLF